MGLSGTASGKPLYSVECRCTMCGRDTDGFDERARNGRRLSTTKTEKQTVYELECVSGCKTCGSIRATATVTFG